MIESSQADKFREAARQAETDDDEKRFDERLKKVAERKPLAPTGAASSSGVRR